MKTEKEVTDKVRCNNCGAVYQEEQLAIIQDGWDSFFKACPTCKTDSNLMQPFMEVAQ